MKWQLIRMEIALHRTPRCSMPREFRYRRALSLLQFLSLAIGLSFFIGCTSSNPSAGSTGESGDAKNKLTKVKLQLNWFPEAEHGCFYAAKAHGFYEQQGLDVEIIPGGKSTVLAQELTLGRVDFAVGNAEDVLSAAEQDAPIVSVMASMQHTPRCILIRKDSGITSFDQLKNVTLLLDTSQAFVAYLKHKGYLDSSVKIAPYFGSIAPLATDKSYGCQGYSFSEPFLAKQSGIDVTVLNVTDIGFDPYCSLLVTSQEVIDDRPDVVQKFVSASIQGLQTYMTDPAKTNAVILENNREGMTAEALDYGAKAVAELCKVGEGDALGAMSSDRWNSLIEQAEAIQFVTASKVTAEKIFTNRFIKP